MAGQSDNPNTKHLNILFTTTIPGTLEFTIPVVQELRADGHKVTYVADTTSGTEISPALEPMISIPMSRSITPIQDLVSLGKWVSLLRRLRPDVLVAGSPKASLLSLRAAKLVGIPTRIYVLHGGVWDGKDGNKAKLLTSVEKIALKSATTVLAVSDSLSRLVVEKGLADTPPTVLGQGSVAGIDLRQYKMRDQVPNNSPKQIAFVGRLAKDKNIDSLIEVFDRAQEQTDLKLELHLYGSLDKTAPIPDWAKQRLQSDPSIICHGYSTDIAGALARADVLVLPSGREGLPQVLLEAQAIGVPIVSWDCTGAADAASPLNAKLLTPIGDTQGMATNLVSVLTEPSLAQELSLDGRTWVEREFDQDLVARRTKDFIVLNSSSIEE